MRQLASVQKILALDPIKNADRIEVATVLGWMTVVKKGEYQVGDQVVFFEIDSLIPVKDWNRFLLSKDKQDAEVVRLKTVKLRGQVSQGLVAPMDILGEYSAKACGYYDGEDVTELIGVDKYEKPIPISLAGKVRGGFPNILPKTDETRIQSDPALIEELQGKLCYWALKCDGTSGTFLNLDNDHQVCSRNLSLLDDDSNVYWKMYRKYNIENALNDAGDFGIQGEVCGPSIQDNTMGLSETELFVFNVRNLKIGRYLGYEDLIAFCKNYELPMVPITQVEVFTYTAEELLDMANTACYPTNGKLAEGYVVRPVEDTYSETLDSRLSVKAISNAYLLKHGK